MSNLLTMSPADFCAATKACREGREWAMTQPTMADVWDNCQRPDWLLWILDAIDQRFDDRPLRLFAIWCARNAPLVDGRKTGDLLTDPRSLAALEVAERYADNNATDEELAAAETAAWAAAWDAWAAAETAAWAAAETAAWAAAETAAWAAAEAAAWAAAEAAARDAALAAWDAARAAALAAGAAAWDAARAAAWAAAGAAAWDAALAAWAAGAAGDAAGDAASAAQADHLRTMVVNPFRKEAQP